MAASSSLETKNRYAICVGINRYDAQDQILPLQFAEQDAKDVYVLLLAHGFDSEHSYLLLGESATWEAMHHALTTLLLTKARKDDLVIFYFAGHSIPISINDDDEDEEQEPQSDVFLCSTNFDLQKIVDERGAWLGYPLRMQKLRTDVFEAARSRKVLFIFDSCHSGDFFGKHYRPRTSENLATRYIEQPFGKNSSGRLVLSSCLPHQTSREDERLRHGVFTYHLLQALAGHDRQAVSRSHEGWVTVGSLFDYLAHKMPGNQRPVKSGAEHDAFKLVYYRQYVEQASMQNIQSQEASLPPHKSLEKEHRLKAMLADHTGFMRNRLESFVGRQNELAEIKKRIAEKTLTGGYVTITGQAGQGKSSIIAKLVDEYGPEKMAFHFIPFKPGPDHQIGLMRNLMAHLILKYNLPEFYVASESRPALRDYFPHVLQEVTKRGGQEVIFIDGLDQLEEDAIGGRDLSFLPNGAGQPPPGIVFVLGTRPNDTLRPMKLLIPYQEYQLPYLRREDFDRILKHRRVELEPRLAEQFYQAMQKNALYLDLVAQEMAKYGTAAPEAIIERIAENPDNLFSLTIERLKRQPVEWREVLKPVLGLLLVIREPVSGPHLRQLLHLDHDRLLDGLHRLGGLVSNDGQGRYGLFHPKFYDYLRQDPSKPGKDFIFAEDEEESWHATLVRWCEQDDIQGIWQDVMQTPTEQGRRLYARKHYVTHLYLAREWQCVASVLDKQQYGKMKVRHDPSMRAYAADLDLGRKLAAREQWTVIEGVKWLPHLWRYTLLRCSLANRADRYPLPAFGLLVLLNREQEAIGLAELLTEPTVKEQVFIQIAMMQRQRQAPDWLNLLLRAEEVIASIKERNERVWRLYRLVEILKSIDEWQRAEEVIASIKESEVQAKALCDLGAALVQAQQKEEAHRIWTRAEEVIASIKESEAQAKILHELSTALVQACEWTRAEEVIASIKESDEQAWALYHLSTALAQAHEWQRAEEVIAFIEEGHQRAWALYHLSTALAQAHEWQRAEEVIASIKESDKQAEALCDLGVALVQAQQKEEALRIWMQAKTMIASIENGYERAKPLYKLSIVLVQAYEWTQAQEVIASIENRYERAKTLHELGIALAQANEWQRAEEVIASIQESNTRTEALHELGIALAQANEWQRAQDVIASIEEDYKRAKTLHGLGIALAQAHEWQQAQDVIASIKESEVQAEALCDLGAALVQAQQKEEAHRIWMQAKTVIASIEGDGVRARALYKLGTALAQAHEWTQAKEVIASMQELAQGFYDLVLEQNGMLRNLASALVQACEWTQAEEVIASIEESEAQAETLCDLGAALVQAQQKKEAHRIWTRIEEAITPIASIKESNARTKVLRELGQTLAQAHEWQRAEEVIASIEESEAQAWALYDLSRDLAREHEWRRAEKVIASIKQSDEQALALYVLSRDLAQEHEWQRAQDVIASIKQSDEQAKASCDLGAALVQAQQRVEALQIWTRAQEVIASIEDVYERAQALYHLSGALVQAHEWQRAQEVIASIKESKVQDKALCDLGAALVQAHEWARVEKAFASIQESELQAKALQNLSSALAQTQQKEEAQRIRRQATTVIASIEDKYVQAGALSGLLVQAQQKEEAQRIWTRAEEVIASIEESETRIWALRWLVHALVIIHEWTEAQTVIASIQESEARTEELRNLLGVLIEAHEWTQAEKMIASVEESEARDDMLGVLASALMQAHEYTEAQTVIASMESNNMWLLEDLSRSLAKEYEWTEAEEVIASIKESDKQAEALCDLGTALVQAQQREEALRIWTRAEEVIASIGDLYERTWALYDLSTALVEAHEWQRAEEVIASIEESKVQARALCDLGAALVQAQQKEEAYRIWTRAEEIIASIEEIEAQAWAMYGLSTALVQTCEWTRAEEIIASINESKARVMGLGDLGRALVEAHEWQRAEEVIPSIQESEARTEALRNLGRALVEAHEWTRAEKAFASIQESEVRTEELCNLATVLVQMHEWQRAEEVIASIEESEAQARALCDLGAALVQTQQREEAQRIWRQATTVIVSIDKGAEQAKGLYNLATTLIQAHEWQRAEEVIASIQESEVRTEALLELGEALTTVNDEEQLLHFVQRSWLRVSKLSEALPLLSLTTGLLHLQPDISTSFSKAFTWVDKFLKG